MLKPVQHDTEYFMIELTLSQLLREKTKANPSHEFMVYADRDLRFTYAQFDKRVDDLACGLYAIGVRKGDNVGIWATNVPDWLTYMFACARLGAVGLGAADEPRHVLDAGAQGVRLLLVLEAHQLPEAVVAGDDDCAALVKVLRDRRAACLVLPVPALCRAVDLLSVVHDGILAEVRRF